VPSGHYVHIPTITYWHLTNSDDKGNSSNSQGN
jgi:hypothetical protein